MTFASFRLTFYLVRSPRLWGDSEVPLSAAIGSCGTVSPRAGKVPWLKSGSAARRGRPLIGRNPLLMILFVLSLFYPALASARSTPPLTEYQIKALYLLNFSRYIEWPDSAFNDPSAQFVIGIVGSDPFDGALEALTAGRPGANRAIVVKRYAATDPSLRDAQILFFPNVEQAGLAEALKHIQGHPVLTVGEHRHFIRHGGIINFTVRGDNVRLEVNLPPAESTGLNISSQLLSVADVVHRGPP